MARANEFGTWSWVAVSVACIAAIGVTELAGLQGKWEDILVFTVLLFATLILLYRPRWGSKSFWWKLLMIFVLHAIAAAVVLQSVQVGPHGIPGFLLTGVTMAEAIFVIILLDRGTKGNRDNDM